MIKYTAPRVIVVGATDRQQQRRRFTTIGEGGQTVVSTIACQLRHQFVRRQQQTVLVAFAGPVRAERDPLFPFVGAVCGPLFGGRAKDV